MTNRQNFTPVRDILDRARNAGTRRFLSLDAPDSDYGTLLLFREYNYTRSDERGFSSLEGSNLTDTIFLPLPREINETLQSRVQRFEQGTTGDVVSSLLSDVDINKLGVTDIATAAISGIAKNMPGIQGNSIGQIVANIDKDLAFLARKTIDNVLPNQGRNVDAGTGTYINPKAALSFEGVDMKTHSFDWVIAPKTPEESENLRLIIETIRRNMLPSYVNTTVVQRAMFKYPSMVDIFFVGIDQAHYFYFKTCMVQTFTTNFTPNGMAVLRGGRPAMVQMQLNLIENDIHTAEDYGGTGTTVVVPPRTPPSNAQ